MTSAGFAPRRGRQSEQTSPGEELRNVGGAFPWLPPDADAPALARLVDHEPPPALVGLRGATGADSVVHALFAGWVEWRMAEEGLDVADSPWDAVSPVLGRLAAGDAPLTDDRHKHVLRELAELYAETFLPVLRSLVRAVRQDAEAVERSAFTARVARNAEAGEISLREAAARLTDNHEKITAAVSALLAGLNRFDPPAGFDERARLIATIEKNYSALVSARAILNLHAQLEDPGDEGGAFGTPARRVLEAAAEYDRLCGRLVNALLDVLTEFDHWAGKAAEEYVKEHYEILFPEAAGVVKAVKTLAGLLGVVAAVLTATGVGAIPGGVAAGLTVVTGLSAAVLDRINRVREAHKAKVDPQIRLDAVTKAARERAEAHQHEVAHAADQPITAGHYAVDLTEKVAEAVRHGSHGAENVGHIASATAHVLGPLGAAFGIGVNALDWRAYAAKQGLDLEQVVTSEAARTAERLLELAARSSTMRVDLSHAEVVDVIAGSGFLIRTESAGEGGAVELFVDEDGRLRRLDVLTLLRARVSGRESVRAGPESYRVDWDGAHWQEIAEDDTFVASVRAAAVRERDNAPVTVQLGVSADAGVHTLGVDERTMSLRELVRLAHDEADDELTGVPGVRVHFHQITWDGTGHTWDGDTVPVVRPVRDDDPADLTEGWFTGRYALPFSTDMLDPDDPAAVTAFAIGYVLHEPRSQRTEVRPLTVLVGESHQEPEPDPTGTMLDGAGAYCIEAMGDSFEHDGISFSFVVNHNIHVWDGADIGSITPAAQGWPARWDASTRRYHLGFAMPLEPRGYLVGVVTCDLRGTMSCHFADPPVVLHR